MFPLLGLVASLTACIPPEERPVSEASPRINLSDVQTRRILNHQTVRQEDSLRHHLSSSSPQHRYLAARGLGSFSQVQPATVDSLVARLTDPAPAVREVAAYALGQTGSRVAPALVDAFDSGATFSSVNAAVLGAVGRTGPDSLVDYLARIESYGIQDTLLREGQLRGLYYAGLRGIIPAAAGNVIASLLESQETPERIRRLAALYLHRFAVPTDSLYGSRLIDVLRRERNPVVSMGLVRTLGRLNNAPARVAVLRQLEGADDWRVRVAALRGLTAAPYASVRESVIEALRDPHPLVRLTAADHLLERANEEDAPFFYQLATSTADTTIGVRLLGAANRHLSPYLPDYRDQINARLRSYYGASDDPFLRAETVRALAEFPWNYRQLYALLTDERSPTVRTVVAEQLARISGRDDFAEWFRGSSARVRRELADHFRLLIGGREEGPAYHAARALIVAPESYRDRYPDLSWLDTALVGFDRPRRLETYREVARAAAALRGEPEPTFTPPPPRPIEWDHLDEGTHSVAIETDQGTIRLRLWPEVAPATVASFMRLTREGYYDGTVFHRVVPNFVAQGGGPRGDGFGSEDFVLPTETPPVFWDRAGLIGMASAGRDTEGVQFFITHRPVPHLDGDYTIFGEVTEGQDIVDRLVPGSRIEAIRIVHE